MPSLPWVPHLTQVLAVLSLLCLPWRPLRIGAQRQDLAPGRTCGMSRPVPIVPHQPHLVPHVGVLTGMGEGPSLLSSNRAHPRAGLSTTVRTALELVPCALCVSYSAKSLYRNSPDFPASCVVGGWGGSNLCWEQSRQGPHLNCAPILDR